MDKSESPSSYSFLQKTLYLFVLPVIYTVVLIFILMAIFNHGGGKFSDQLVSIAKRIPIVQKMMPTAVMQTNEASTQSKVAANQNQNLTQKLQDSENKINDQQQQINQVQTEVKQKDDANQAMQKQIQDLNEQLKTKQQTEDELKQKANNLALEYTTMQPKQAAGILDTMPLNDAVFALSAMKPQQVSGLLANMDPKRAADVSTGLKDYTLSKDNELASLQQKIQQVTEGKQSLDELVKTYSQMPAQNAAKLVEEIMKTDEKKALLIMSQMNAASSASILSAMSSDKTNPDAIKQAAQITKSLMP
jgi:flagellar motility protein MotE (MotC chaperone)